VGSTASRAGGEIDAPPEAQLTHRPTLSEHLKDQLRTCELGRAARAVACALVDWLDEDGYLREADDTLAAHLGVPVKLVGAARSALQRCEPAGIGGHDLATCLAIQLREKDRLDPAMQAMLRHLPLVARADFAALQRVCRVDHDDIRDMIGEIKRLDPQPGRSFAPAEPIEAIPDVLIHRVGQSWRVELNEATLPRVLVDRAYYAELTAGGSLTRREREFVAERYQAASWLAKALDQRARTMLKVAEAIFERQIGFLSGGAACLRPLVLREIAAATGMHESTVSRATADKFVMTPRGTFPLRYFFTTAIAGTDGEETHSAEAIRQQIRRMIEAEPAESVLSDDQIVSLLKSGGVAIARRTVAKYRESLGIASSVQRRRSKALCL
jgi:RNA polymerase sigma-54 factor